MAKTKAIKVIDDINEVIVKIDIPPHKWPGNCMLIASACYHAGCVPKDSRVCYGVYLGEIHEDSRFADRPFSHHAWIELPDFTIYDPTQWAFTMRSPHIWRGHARNDDYDLGFSTQYRHQAPPLPTQTPSVKIPKSKWRMLNKRVPKMQADGPDWGQWNWLAHRHPDELGTDAKWIYQFMAKNKMAGIIPVDFKRYVMRINPALDEVIKPD